MRAVPTLSLLTLFAACVEPPLETVEQEMTEATLTDDARWSVFMVFSNGAVDKPCSGIVLTSRWALTAGHCVEEINASSVAINATVAGGSVGFPDSVYGGSIMWRKHSSLDIALVHLSRSGSGIDLGKTGKAKIWNHPWNPPWQGGSAADRTYDLIGWGDTNQSPGAGCQAQVNDPPVKYKGAFELDGNSSSGDARVHGDSSVREGCDGDSGAPWVITRGGIQMAFALHEGDIWVPFDIEEVGILLNRLMPWMASTSSQMYGARSTVGCTTGFLVAGVSYTECSEGPAPTPPPPPPPGNGCPQNWVCCADGPQPGTCDQCAASWGVCE